MEMDDPECHITFFSLAFSKLRVNESLRVRIPSHSIFVSPFENSFDCIKYIFSCCSHINQWETGESINIYFFLPLQYRSSICAYYWPWEGYNAIKNVMSLWHEKCSKIKMSLLVLYLTVLCVTYEQMTLSQRVVSYSLLKKHKGRTEEHCQPSSRSFTTFLEQNGTREELVTLSLRIIETRTTFKMFLSSWYQSQSITKRTVFPSIVCSTRNSCSTLSVFHVPSVSVFGSGPRGTPKSFGSSSWYAISIWHNGTRGPGNRRASSLGWLDEDWATV